MSRKPGAWVCLECAAAKGLDVWGNVRATPGWCAAGLHEVELVRWSPDAIATGARPPWVGRAAADAYIAAGNLLPAVSASSASGRGSASKEQPKPAASQGDLFGA